jgi:L-alanine-DL-glutamate epimerase-like enolase superfamily enzyme
VAEAYEINIAPHNFYSPLATMMSMHLCAVAPNVRIMEMDVDQAPWVDELVTVKPEIRDGYLELPTGVGWGTEVDEAAVQAHPAHGTTQLLPVTATA